MLALVKKILQNPVYVILGYINYFTFTYCYYVNTWLTKLGMGYLNHE